MTSGLLERRLRAPGFWHLGGGGDQGIAGYLHYSPSQGLSLQLVGSLEADNRRLGGGEDTVAIITGIAHSPATGGYPHVVLFDCLRTKRSYSTSGLAVERYKPHFALLTSGQLQSANATWKQARVHLSNLWSWGRPGRPSLWSTEAFEEQERVVFGRRRELLRVDAPFGDVRFGLSVLESSTAGHLRLSEDAYLAIELQTPLSARAIVENTIAPLQDLLSFVVNQPSAVDDVSVSDLDNGVVGSLLYNRVFTHRLRRKEETALDVLLPFAALAEEDWRRFIAHWFEFHQTHRAFCASFFGAEYARIPFVELRFMAAVRSADLLWRSISRRDRLTEVISSETDASSASLRSLLELRAGLIRPLLPDLSVFAEQAEWWTQQIDSVDERGDFDGAALHWFTETLRLAVRLWIAAELHPSAAEYLVRSQQVLWMAEKYRGLPAPSI